MKTVFLILFLICNTAFAKKFETSYLTANIPSTLDCKRVKTLWICKNFKMKQSDIIIYFSSKVTGPGENFQGFEKQLKMSRTIENQEGKLLTSKVYHTKRYLANNHTWVESLHFNSELEHYFTYYYFTTNKNLSIAAMVTVHKGAVKKYHKSLQAFKKSLKLKDITVKVRDKKLAKKDSQGFGQGLGDTGSKITALTNKLGTGKKKYISIAFILIAIGLLAYSFKK